VAGAVVELQVIAWDFWSFAGEFWKSVRVAGFAAIEPRGVSLAASIFVRIGSYSQWHLDRADIKIIEGSGLALK
jgi:hypothetical protein